MGGFPAGFPTPWPYFKACVSVAVFLSTGPPCKPRCFEGQIGPGYRAHHFRSAGGLIETTTVPPAQRPSLGGDLAPWVLDDTLWVVPVEWVPAVCRKFQFQAFIDMPRWRQSGRAIVSPRQHVLLQSAKGKLDKYHSYSYSCSYSSRNNDSNVDNSLLVVIEA